MNDFTSACYKKSNCLTFSEILQLFHTFLFFCLLLDFQGSYKSPWHIFHRKIWLKSIFSTNYCLITENLLIFIMILSRIFYDDISHP